MQSEYLPRKVSANVYSWRACVSSVSAYAGSVGRKAIEAAASAAEVSPARSEPGHVDVMRNDGRAICITSAGPHQAWSVPPWPICPYSSFGAVCARTK
jgi:hypothetical protein